MWQRDSHTHFSLKITGKPSLLQQTVTPFACSCCNCIFSMLRLCALRPGTVCCHSNSVIQRMCLPHMCGGRKERREERRLGRRKGGSEEGGRNPPYLSTVQGKYRQCDHSNKLQLNCAIGFSYKIIICKMLQNMWILNFRSISKIKIQNEILTSHDEIINPRTRRGLLGQFT